MKELDFSHQFISRLVRRTLAVILAGGRGSRLKGLTESRAKPAMPFGGKYRIIDFPLSNCLNSGIRQIEVITQYKAHTLIRHLSQGWNFLRGDFEEFIEILPAQQQHGMQWYQGTADAVFQNLGLMHAHRYGHALILGGDHVYKMDYGTLMGFHVSRGADVTIGLSSVPVDQASRYGIVRLDSNDRVVDFCEKPNQLSEDWCPGGQAVASMGIYVFNRDFLDSCLLEDSQRTDSSHDFGHDILPRLLPSAKILGFRFTNGSGAPAYWRDIGDLDAYWKSNMELAEVLPECNLYDLDWPIWTAAEQGPPAKFVFDEPSRKGMALNSLIAGGAIISGSVIRASVISRNVRIEDGCEIEQSVILSGATIGSGSRLRRVVVEEGANLQPGSWVGYDGEADARCHERSPGGITLVR
jgi:glucose-1-phosphate adenylyltransferase